MRWRWARRSCRAPWKKRCASGPRWRAPRVPRRSSRRWLEPRMQAEPIGVESDRDRIERELFLRTTIGRNLPSARELAELLRPVVFDAGEVIYREGDASDEMYFVRRGKVELS